MYATPGNLSAVTSAAPPPVQPLIILPTPPPVPVRWTPTPLPVGSIKPNAASAAIAKAQQIPLVAYVGLAGLVDVTAELAPLERHRVLTALARTVRPRLRRLVEQVSGALSTGDVNAARQLCLAERAPVAGVLLPMPAASAAAVAPVASVDEGSAKTALVAHVRGRVDHYLSAEVVDHMRAEFDALDAAFAP